MQCIKGGLTCDSSNFHEILAFCLTKYVTNSTFLNVQKHEHITLELMHLNYVFQLRSCFWENI